MNTPLGPWADAERREAAYNVREKAAHAHRFAPIPDHPNNGDDELYANRCGSFSKGLEHNADGEVTPLSYQTFLNALRSGKPEDFELMRMGSSGAKLTSPQAGYAFDLESFDPHAVAMPPAPAFASREEVAEICENYWMALLRDVAFGDYDGHSGAAKAAADLNSFGADFKGRKDGNGKVTVKLLFRGLAKGEEHGPFISQFLIHNVPFGVQGWEQLMRPPKKEVDYLTAWDWYLAAQNGNPPAAPTDAIEKGLVYLRNGRDLSQWVHLDVLFQAYFNAFLIMGYKDAHPSSVGGGIGTLSWKRDPYRGYTKQGAFATLGGPWLIATLCEVASRALKAVWCQKYRVHRRLRPENFAACIHLVESGRKALSDYPIHPDYAGMQALVDVKAHNAAQNSAAGASADDSWLLPMAFPEGCPTHPAYGAGHATVAGACVTILKAIYDSEQAYPLPLEVAPGGMALSPYSGGDAGAMTIEGELNKLASNIAVGRNIAGVHWRSDGTESLDLGEAVAIGLLKELRGTLNEKFDGFEFNTFRKGRVLI